MCGGKKFPDDIKGHGSDVAAAERHGYIYEGTDGDQIRKSYH